MDSCYDTICGITDEEIQSYFSESVQQMARENGLPADEMKEILKKQYNGYHFSEGMAGTGMVDIYNPFSIMNEFQKNRVKSYWYASGTPMYLVKLLEDHNINMQRLLDRRYSESCFMDYRADIEDPLAMLYQSGYLTIKDYDRRYPMNIRWTIRTTKYETGLWL